MYEDGRIRVLWDATLCIHTAICLQRLPQVFDVRARPWVDLAGAAPEDIAATIRACPMDALRYDGEEVAEELPDDATTIEVRPNGPLLCADECASKDRAAARGRGASSGLVQVWCQPE